ncbi:MAG TPA: thioesterase family protein [Acidimicrobiales bacterium]|nr:thioesterase family protein [Acidimicrobiales bacterium]
MTYRHRILVRYGEVDMQRVVFNAHYLAYCDDAVETWLRTIELDPSAHQWDFMLKRAVLEWDGPATVGDEIVIDVAVARWGSSSFDVGFTGSVGERRVFTATITYVSVEPGANTPKVTPGGVRSALSA